MEIEKQRWAPLPAACANADAGPFGPKPGVGAYGWSQASPRSVWEKVFESEYGSRLLFDIEYKPAAGPSPEDPTAEGWIAIAYIWKNCTEYASYQDAWKLAQGTADDVAFFVEHAFDGKGARILDLDIHYDNNQLRFSVILVANYGPAARAWWGGVGCDRPESS